MSTPMPEHLREKVFVYSMGLCNVSVCAPKTMPIEEVTRGTNIEHPTGISSRWKLNDAKTFKGGEPNPCPCNDLPSERLHYLFVC